MSEYLCPITDKLCPRPGKVVPGASVLSDEGYCAGEESADPICPEIIKYVESGNLLSKPNLRKTTYERADSTTVVVRKMGKKHGSKSEVPIMVTMIESGHV